MKKFFKGLLKFIAVIIALYLITAMFSPANYKVEKSRFMKADVEYIYEQLASFENWSNWSPWEEKDSTAIYELTGEDGIVGTKYSWVGDPELSGVGNLVFTELIPNEKLSYELTFEDWEMTSRGLIQLFVSDSGTMVTWVDEGDFDFLVRPMMLFMDMDEQIGPDFDRGLERIDSVTTNVMESFNFEIYEINFPTTKYFGVTIDTLITAIDSSIYANAYGQVIGYLYARDIEMAGMPIVINNMWNTETGRCNITPAIPVNDFGEFLMSQEIVLPYTIDSCKAMAIDYYGNYDNLGKAHEQLLEYLQSNRLEYIYAIEEFVTEPANIESMDDVLTRIYYLLK